MPEGRPAPEKSRDIVPRRTRDIVPRIARQLGKQFQHRTCELKPDPDWTSHSSQRHVRDIALDPKQNRIWLATWGGVLCLFPADGLCIRHNSEHGLIGNAMRGIALDNDGVVWASGQRRGLCSLLPEENSSWRVHDDLNSWRILRMIPSPGGGVYVAVSDAEGRSAIRRVGRSSDHKSILLRGGLVSKDVEALVVDDQGHLWIGNIWGLHRYTEEGAVDSFEFETPERARAQVVALARGVGGNLWVGTNRGLYRFRAEGQPRFQEQPDWPRDQILALDEESVSGHLWVATTREIGRIVNNNWQPVLKSPSDRLNILRVANVDADCETYADKGTFGAGHAWAGGANGLYSVGLDGFESVLTPNHEDALSNAVQSLWARDSRVWMGTARGLFSYEENHWTTQGAKNSELRDVRTIVSTGNNGALWIGTARKGLCRLENGIWTAELLNFPVVSLAIGADGSLWAATPDAIYLHTPGNQEWKQIGEMPRGRLESCVIQAICGQLVQLGGKRVSILWVGTATGLFSYHSDEHGPRDPVAGDLAKLSIQTLAVDPLTNHLWVGTSNGLFSEYGWKRHREGDVRAIVFGPPPACELWVGTAEQIERWPTPGEGDVFAGKPAAAFSSHNAGLAGEEVTSLTVRLAGNDQREVWIGSSNGVSCYRYSP